LQHFFQLKFVFTGGCSLTTFFLCFSGLSLVAFPFIPLFQPSASGHIDSANQFFRVSATAREIYAHILT